MADVNIGATTTRPGEANMTVGAAHVTSPAAPRWPAMSFFALDVREGSDPRVKVAAPVLTHQFDVGAVVAAIGRIISGGGDCTSAGGGGVGADAGGGGGGDAAVAARRDAAAVCEAVAAALLADRDMTPTNSIPMEALEFIVPEVG